MSFISIRKKLVLRVSLILGLAFIAVLSLVSTMSINTAQETLSRSEKQIENALLAKGEILTQNNSEALKGMVEDNAFSAIQALVSSTVAADADILFGVFMDVDSSPWVKVTPDNPSGQLQNRDTLVDANSQWVASLTEFSVKETTIDGQSVYLFAAPINVDDEILGFIQYALSNKAMLAMIDVTRNESQKSLIQTISLLLILGLVTGLFSFLAIRKMAGKISEPLNELKKSAELISTGDYDTAIDVESNDEIGLLANNFDEMRSTIQKKIKDLGELNALGQSLSVIENEKELLNVSLIKSHLHANAEFSCIYSVNENQNKQLKAQHPQDQNSQQWTDALQHLIDSQQLNSTAIKKHQLEVSGQHHIAIEIPFLAGDDIRSRMILCGSDGSLVLNESDHEYFQSLSQMVLASQQNVLLKNEIEEHNRNLEITIKERTASLQEKTNDISNMMENMHQGLFTIMEDGSIHPEYAKYLENIFNTRDIAGSNAIDLLFSNAILGEDEKNQVTTVLTSLIGSDEMMFSFNSHLLTPLIEINLSGATKILELDWDPIVLNDIISKIMVTVRDVTELKALEGEAAEQKQELEMIGQILALNTEKFFGFLDSAFSFIDTNRALINNHSEKSTTVIDDLFRNMHTIKGNARTYSLSYVTDAVHIAESTYDVLRKEEQSKWNPEQLLKELETVHQGLTQYQHINKEVLHRDNAVSAPISHDRISIEKCMLDTLISDLQSAESSIMDSKAKAQLIRVNYFLSHLDTCSLGEILKDVCHSTKSLAQELGKPAPVIEINSAGLSIRNNVRELLNNIFMHNFRNALDHGIEHEQTRIEKGKTPEGHIYLNAVAFDNYLELRMHDDGQGVSLKKIKQKALEQGILHENEDITNQELANLLFVSGLTTAETLTDVSGRGVGMDAVKRFINDNGGEVNIELSDQIDEQDADLVPFELLIKLPQNTFVKDSNSG